MHPSDRSKEAIHRTELYSIQGPRVIIRACLASLVGVFRNGSNQRALGYNTGLRGTQLNARRG